MESSIWEILAAVYIIGGAVMGFISVILCFAHYDEITEETGDKNPLQWLAAIVFLIFFWPIILLIAFFK